MAYFYSLFRYIGIPSALTLPDFVIPVRTGTGGQAGIVTNKMLFSLFCLYNWYNFLSSKSQGNRIWN
jgi:hypothetical protein